MNSAVKMPQNKKCGDPGWAVSSEAAATTVHAGTDAPAHAREPQALSLIMVPPSETDEIGTARSNTRATRVRPDRLVISAHSLFC